MKAKQGYQIREMKLEDAPQLAALEQKIFSDAWSVGSIESTFAQPNGKIFVAQVSGEEPSEVDGGTIVGYHILYTALEEADVARIAVNEAYQRCGIADALLKQAWQFCEESRIERVLLEVRSGNHGAIMLYEKHGFQSLGVRKNYYREPLEDALIMEKMIDITTSN